MLHVAEAPMWYFLIHSDLGTWWIEGDGLGDLSSDKQVQNTEIWNEKASRRKQSTVFLKSIISCWFFNITIYTRYFVRRKILRGWSAPYWKVAHPSLNTLVFAFETSYISLTIRMFVLFIVIRFWCLKY